MDFSDLIPSKETASTERDSLSFDDLIPKRELPGTKFEQGLTRGLDMFQQFSGSAIEGLGSATGLESVERFGRDTAAFNRAELGSYAPGMTTEDIDGVGSLGGFVAEKLGESAIPMGTSIGAAALAGGIAGSVVPGLGNVAGALIGAGAATIANLPYMFGSFRERQKDADIEAGREIQVDEGAALMYALPASALDSVSDLFIVGKLAKPFKPLLESGSLLTRVTTNTATGATAESLTEVGQTVLERHQAGLSLTDEDAQREYFEAAVAGGLIGGSVSAATSVRKPKPTVENTGGGTDAAERAALRGDATSTTQTDVAPDQTVALTGAARAREIMQQSRARQAAAAPKPRVTDPMSDDFVAPGRNTPAPAPAVDLTPEQRVAANQQAAAETGIRVAPTVTTEVTTPEATAPATEQVAEPAEQVAAETPAPTQGAAIQRTSGYEGPSADVIENRMARLNEIIADETKPERVRREAAGRLRDFEAYRENRDAMLDQNAVDDEQRAAVLSLVPDDIITATTEDGYTVTGTISGWAPEGTINVIDQDGFYHNVMPHTVENIRRGAQQSPAAASPMDEALQFQPNQSQAAAPAATPQVTALPVDQDGAIETVPESREQIDAQMRDMLDKKNPRVAVFVPFGGYMPAKPNEAHIGKVEVRANRETGDEAGVIFYNSQKKLGNASVGKGLVKALEGLGRRNELLGLGPYNKSEVGADANLAVVKRNAEGVPTVEIAASESTVEDQVNALESDKTVDETVEVKAAEEVIAERQAATQPGKAATVVATSRRRSKKQEPAVRTLKDFDPEEVARIEAAANAKAPKAEEAKETSAKRTIVLKDEATAERTDDAYDEQAFLRKRAAAEEELRTKKEQELAAKKAELQRKVAENDFKDAEDEARSRIEANQTEATHAKDRQEAKVATAIKAGRLVEQLRASLQVVTGSKAGFRMVESEGDGEKGALTIIMQMRDILREAGKQGIRLGRNVDDTVASPVAFLIDLRTQVQKLEKLPKEDSESVRLEILAEVNAAIQDLNAYLVGNDATGLRERRLTEGGIASEGVGGMDVDSFVDERAELDRDEETDETDPDDYELVPEPTRTTSEDIVDLAVGDRAVWMSENGRAVVAVTGVTTRDGGLFYKVRSADGTIDTVAADSFTLFRLQPAKQIGSGQATSAAVDAPAREKGPVQVEVKKNRKINKPVRGMGDTDTDVLVKRDGSEFEIATRSTTLAELRDDVVGPQSMLRLTDTLRKFTSKQKTVQRMLGNRMLRALLDVVGDVRVAVLSDAYFDMYAPNGDAYYNKDGDYIAIRQSVMDDPTAAMHTVIHEAAHAAFEHTIEKSAEFTRQMGALLKLAKDHAAKTGFGDARGFADIHEFLSETWASPRFQEFLATVPVPENALSELDIKPSQVGIIRSVLDWVKARLVNAMGIRQVMAQAGYDLNTTSGLEAALEIGGKILETSPRGRQEYYASQKPLKTDSEAFKKWFGKSKVVTSGGKPTMLYHGMGGTLRGEARTFDGVNLRPSSSGTLGPGVYLTDSPSAASGFAMDVRAGYTDTRMGGQVFPAYAKLENPLTDVELQKPETRAAIKEVVDSIKDKSPATTIYLSRLSNRLAAGEAVTISELATHSNDGRRIVTGVMDQVSDALRDLGYDGIISDTGKGYTEYVVFDPKSQIKSAFNVGTFDPANPDIRMMEREVDPDSIEGKLRARGLDTTQARNVAAMIDEEFDGTATDEELDAIVGALGKPVGSQQGLTGPSPFMPPKLPGRVAKLFGAGRPPKAGPLNKALLYVMTMDFIDLKFRKYFGDKAGNALSDYVNAAFAYQKVAQDVAALHDLDFADFEDLRREKPAEAAKIQKLVAMLQATDIDIADGASNDHLKKTNARKYLQSKAALPEVQQIMASMDPETLKLVRRMARNFTASHNDYIRAVTETILDGLPTPLTKAVKDRIIDNVVNAKLDAQDKADVNDDAIYAMLERSEFLKKRKGSYFPAERFGEWVVTTDLKVDDPKITSVVTKSGRATVPITTEIDGGTVRFIFDYGIRGSRGAVAKKVYDWVAKHELPLQSYVVKYRDRQTGEIVGKGDMDVTKDYDMVHEVKLQNKGVHFFEDVGDARAFEEQAVKDKAAGKLLRHSPVRPKHEQKHREHLIPPGAVDAVFSSIDKNPKLAGNDIRKQQLKNAVQDAIIRSTVGNRYEKRLMGRQNIIGASDEVGRAAANYGRSVGNAIAQIRSGGARADAMQRMREIAKAKEDDAEVGIIDHVVNELVTREDLDYGPLNNNQMLDNLSTINAIDKLMSPANWFLNMTQVPMNSLPYLGGKFGNVKAARTILSAYQRIGAGGALKSGLKNTGKAATRIGKARIDLDDVLGSIRKNVGTKYDAMFDMLIETGDITDNAGIENAQQLAGGRGMAGTALVKMDRIMRAMPNAIEAINRSTVAVAAYDMALASGMSKQDAIAYTREALRRTQFRYDETNKSRLMRSNPALRFFFTFKQYGQGQYQMLADALGRAMTDATPQERAQARKQLFTLFGMQVLAAGVFSLPAIEVIKTAVMLGTLLGLGEGWEDEVEDLRQIMRDSYGQTVEEIVSKGLLSKVLGVNLSSRMSWADLILGYPPRSGEKQDVMAWLGQTLAGPQGSMVYEFFIAGPKALIEGDYVKGLTLMLPVKTIADTVKAAGAAADGKMDPVDAAKQVAGFQSMRQARIADATGARIRESGRKKKEVGDLIADYLNAVSRGDVVKAAAAIREYNASLPKDGRKINIGDANSGLEKRRRENVRMYQE